MPNRLVVSALVPVVLVGCEARTSCSDFDPERERLSEVLYLDEAALADVLDTAGELSEDECARLCMDWATGRYSDVTVTDCTLSDGEATDTASDGPQISCSYTGTTTCKGRMHVGVRSRRSARTGLGGWFSAAAHDEAAAVKAFHALAHELTGHGAPNELVSRAKAAARDEIRHARLMCRLAREQGVEPVAPRFRSTPVRDLCAIGVENAAEGCVRETFAALLAHHQARRAWRRFRPVFARLADDETRHAQWSWDLDAWLATVLSRRDLGRIREAREAAVAALDAGPAGPRGLGLPSETGAMHMVQRFAAAVRSHA